MNKNMIFGIALLVLVVGGLFAIGGRTFVMIPHGYDGVVSNICEIEHSYDQYNSYNDFYWSGIDPYGDWGPLQTGVRAQISAPQYLRNEDYSPVSQVENFIDYAGVEWEENITQVASIYTFEMSMNIQTYGDGWLTIEDVTFWIELKNNDYTVFTQPDEVAVAILGVVTTEFEVLQRGDGIEIDPEGIGFDCPLVSIEGSSVNVPDYYGNMVNLDNFQRLTDVKFPVHVVTATPTPVSIIDWRRVEAQVFLQFEIDVLVLGQWNKLRPLHDVEPPPPQLTFWEQLGKIIQDLFPDLVSLVIIIIGLAGTIVIFWKVPDVKIKFIAVALLWAILAIPLGWYDGLQGILGAG